MKEQVITMNIEIKVIDVRKPKSKVCIYARTIGSEEKLNSQIHRMMAFAEANNLEVTGLVTDRGSAANIDRIEMEILLEGVEIGKYDGILTTSMDRFANDEEDAYSFIDRIHFFGGIVYTLEEGRCFINYDTGC